MSLDKLGDLAVAQGDLAGALRNFTECKSIAERLAATDPKFPKNRGKYPRKYPRKFF